MSLQRVAFSPLHTFTRATNETFFNQVVDSFGNVSYQLQTAPSGTAVQNAYNPATGEPLGLQVFEQRTNLLTYSEQLNDASWSKANSTVSANATIAPDGTLTADAIIESLDASAASHQTVKNASFTAGQKYTLSFFAKSNGREYITIRIFAGTAFAANKIVSFDLQNGTAVNSVSFPADSFSIQSAGNGWYRCSITATADNSGTNSSGFLIAESSSSTTYIGDGVSGLYIWGAQLEAGAFPTPYIKTEATTATRNASVAVINDIDESEWWNPSEGTFVVELTRSSVNAIRSERIIEVSDGTTANRVLIQKAAGLNLGQIITINGGVSVINDFTISQALDSVKIAFNLTSSAFKLSLNGGSVASFSETIPLSGFSQLRIGTAITGMFLNGHIAKIQYYPTAVSDAKLQELSTL